MKLTNKPLQRTLQSSIITCLLLFLFFQNASGFQLTSQALLTSDTPSKKEIPVTAVPEKPEDISPLLTGETIPSFVLPDATGKVFDVSKAVAQQPTILIFYRGGWCPYCTKQLSGIQAIEADLTKLGYQIIAISTDSPEYLARSLGEEKLSYTLLSDSELMAAKKFGIAYKGPENYSETLIKHSDGKNADKLLPVPSVFILDTAGIIRFEYINPDITERISPAMLKAVASTLVEELQAKK